MPPPNVFELRNYRMRPGRRDDLIALFEREFVESQEALGASIVGTFRNLDEPARFVWLRAFADMTARAAALDGFYTSDLWRANRAAANATIVDNDDVLLLRPVSGALAPVSRPPLGATAIPEALMVATTYRLAPRGDDAFAAFFADEIAPTLRDTGAAIVGTLASEHSANSYPRLPVREGTRCSWRSRGSLRQPRTRRIWPRSGPCRNGARGRRPRSSTVAWRRRTSCACNRPRVPHCARERKMSTVDDFDFLMGDWRVAHRRLTERLAGCEDWDEFSGACSARRILGGQGNFDDNWLDLPSGPYRAATMRAFDPETRQWAIWWLDARHPHALDAPMVGGFEGGVGAFYADDTFKGRAIRVRFLWTQLEDGRLKWEQAFSPDNGASWEINWVMHFTRAA